MANDTVNYSIRLDVELREQMKDIPDMPEKIREYIRQEITHYQEADDDGSEERFIRTQLSKHGIVGAYCVLQLAYHVGDRYYLANVETRFPDNTEARLTAKQIRDSWDDHTIRSLETQKIVEDVLAEETHKDEDQTPSHASYLDRLEAHAANRIETAISQENTLAEQVYWTAWQLGRDKAKRGSTSFEGGLSIERRSFEETIQAASDVDEESVKTAIGSLAGLGAVQSHTHTNSYSYDTVYLPEFLFTAFETALSQKERDIRNRIRDYANEPVYLERIQAITQDENFEERYNPDAYLYRNTQPQANDAVQEEYSEYLPDMIKDGAVVIEYSTGRRAKSGRGATPSERIYVLSPSVRQVIGDAIYKQQAEK